MAVRHGVEGPRRSTLASGLSSGLGIQPRKQSELRQRQAGEHRVPERDADAECRKSKPKETGEWGCRRRDGDSGIETIQERQIEEEPRGAVPGSP